MHDAIMLAELIRANQPCVALTGAGVSTESGIPDFRSAEGIWSRFDPFEVASIDAFRREPARVWEFYALRLDVLDEARPNAGHTALARLEEAGLLRAVVTQNVDGLHAAAGSRDVVEVHGSLAHTECLECGTRVGRDDVRALLPLPRCPRCGSVLKPGVVMFGELLPAAGDRTCAGARARSGAPTRHRFVPGGLAGCRPPRRDAGPRRGARDSEPGADGFRQPGAARHPRLCRRDARGVRGASRCGGENGKRLTPPALPARDACSAAGGR